MNVELVAPEQAPLLARPYFNGDQTSPLVRALAQVPEFLEATMPFIGVVFGDSSVPARVKEIVVLRVSALHRCHYCTQTHTAAALECGLSLDEVRALRGEGPLPESFTPLERAVIEFSSSLSHEPERAVAALRLHFPDHQIIELVTVGGATIFLNRFASSLGLPPSNETLAKIKEAGIA